MALTVRVLCQLTYSASIFNFIHKFPAFRFENSDNRNQHGPGVSTDPSRGQAKARLLTGNSSRKCETRFAESYIHLAMIELANLQSVATGQPMLRASSQNKSISSQAKKLHVAQESRTYNMMSPPCGDRALDHTATSCLAPSLLAKQKKQGRADARPPRFIRVTRTRIHKSTLPAELEPATLRLNSLTL